MRIIIFGGAGFIGTNITIEALKQGYKVTVVDNLSRKGTRENLKIIKRADFVKGDVRDPKSFNRLRGDAIINLAGDPSVPWSIEDPVFDFEENARGSLNVLEFAKKRKVPVIFASTNRVYSEEFNEIPTIEKDTRYEYAEKYKTGISEDFPTDGKGMYPHTPYGCSKLCADTYHQEYFHLFQVPAVINRMSCIYGLYQKGVSEQGWVDHFVRTILLGDRKIDIFGNGKQVRDMLYGSDVAKLYLMQIEQIDKIKGNIFNVGGGNDFNISVIELIHLIQKLTGKKAKLKYSEWRYADPKIYITDNRKVKKLINWRPETSVEDGIMKMIDQYSY